MQLATSLRDLIEGAESLVHIEDLSSKKGFLQSLNPLTKLIATLTLIVGSLFIPSAAILALMCLIPLTLSLVSRIPLRDFVVRTTLIPFFALIISLPVLFITPGVPLLSSNLGFFNIVISSEGISNFLLFTVRVWFCVAILTVFMLTTGFNSFLRLLSSLGVPALLIQLFVLTYRYLFVSIREIQRVLIAKEARTYFTRHTLNIESLKHSGALLANIFIRTYERSERVYLAMKSRGFDVNNTAPSKVQSFHKTDLLFVASSIAIFGIFALI